MWYMPDRTHRVIYYSIPQHGRYAVACPKTTVLVSIYIYFLLIILIE